VARGVTVGIDLGGTKVLGLAVDDEGVVLSEVRVPTPRRRAAPGKDSQASELVIEVLASVVERLVDKTDGEVSSVAVGAPGLVDNTGVLRYAPNLPRGTGLDIAGRLSARLGGMRTVVDNDATCATVAEWAFGAAEGFADAVMVTLGTGIGGGVIAGGHVLRGASGFAGEIGHMVVDPAGPPCPCGRRGCWERFASGAGLGVRAREAALAGRLGQVVKIAGGDPESVRGEDVSAAAAAGDPEARRVIEEVGWWLGFGLANLACVLDPECFVLGGGLVHAGDPLLDSARATFAGLVEGGTRRPLAAIVPAAFDERAGAVGAALAARQGGL
jgi:glucokinase